MNENQNLNKEEVNINIPPIEEVKVDSFTNINEQEPKVENLIQTNNNEPPKSGKGSTILLILLFIFLFAFIMGMPYLREYLTELKADSGLSEIEKEAIEEEKRQEIENQPTPTPEVETLQELVCTLGEETASNYTLVKTEIFYYNSNNQVISSKNISEYQFTVEDDTYHTLKTQCDEDSLKYLTHEGYTMACSYGESNITISHEFELETFVPIIEGTTNIQANASYKQNIDVIKTDLISKGYACQ